MNKAPADKISSITARPPPPSVFWVDGTGVALGSSLGGSDLLEDLDPLSEQVVEGATATQMGRKRHPAAEEPDGGRARGHPEPVDDGHVVVEDDLVQRQAVDCGPLAHLDRVCRGHRMDTNELSDLLNYSRPSRLEVVVVIL